MVLNSLRGEAARDSQNCLGKLGRFVEPGKKDLLANDKMETHYLSKSSTFAVVELMTVARYRPWII